MSKRGSFTLYQQLSRTSHSHFTSQSLMRRKLQLAVCTKIGPTMSEKVCNNLDWFSTDRLASRYNEIHDIPRHGMQYSWSARLMTLARAVLLARKWSVFGLGATGHFFHLLLLNFPFFFFKSLSAFVQPKRLQKKTKKKKEKKWKKSIKSEKINVSEHFKQPPPSSGRTSDPQLGTHLVVFFTTRL